MDTSEILFICGGAFEGIEKIIESRTDRKSIGFGATVMTRKERETNSLLKELQPHDLMKYGIIPELIGRLPVLTTLEPLSREQLVNILTEPKNALVRQYKRLMELDGVELEFQPEALRAVADAALERGIGARGLRAVVEDTMNQLMYEVPSDPAIVKIIITPGAVRHTEPPLLERDGSRRERPRMGQPVQRGAKNPARRSTSA